MKNFLSSWYTVYEDSMQRWTQLPSVDKEKRLHYLTTYAGALLDEWIKMDEGIHQLRNNKENLVHYESKGTYYYSLDMFSEAAAQLATERAIGDEDELRLLYKGFAHLFANELNRAKETFLYVSGTSNNALRKHFAYCGIGCVEVRSGRLDEAIVAFESAKRLTPSDDVVYNLGVCHYFGELFHVAKIYLKQYVQRVPHDGEALFYLGCCEWEAGEKELAWEYLLCAIQLLQTPASLFAFAYVCEWFGHHELAIHSYKQLRQMGENKGKVLHGLAWNYALLQDEQKAIALFKEALLTEKEDDTIYKSLQWLQKNFPEGAWEQLVVAR